MLIDRKVFEMKCILLLQAATEPGANVDTKGTAAGRREIAAIGRAEKAQVTYRESVPNRDALGKGRR